MYSNSPSSKIQNESKKKKEQKKKQTHMIQTPMDNNIKILLLLSSSNRQPPQLIDLIRRMSDMNFPPIRPEKMSQTFTRMMTKSMRMCSNGSSLRAMISLFQVVPRVGVRV